MTVRESPPNWVPLIPAGLNTFANAEAQMFFVCCFSRGQLVGELLVSLNEYGYRIAAPARVTESWVDGFCANDRPTADFIVATRKTEMGGRHLPDWSSPVVVGFLGRAYSDADLVGSHVWNLVFLRRICIHIRGGEVLSRWYVPPWRDWLLPADPFRPWGRDFYRFLNFRINETRP